MNKDKRAESCKVLIFKTSLQTPVEVHFLEELLRRTKGVEEWSVDLENWEKILRVVSTGITAPEVIELLQKVGIQSKALND